MTTEAALTVRQQVRKRRMMVLVYSLFSLIGASAMTVMATAMRTESMARDEPLLLGRFLQEFPSWLMHRSSASVFVGMLVSWLTIYWAAIVLAAGMGDMPLIRRNDKAFLPALFAGVSGMATLMTSSWFVALELYLIAGMGVFLAQMVLLWSLPMWRFGFEQLDLVLRFVTVRVRSLREQYQPGAKIGGVISFVGRSIAIVAKAVWRNTSGRAPLKWFVYYVNAMDKPDKVVE